MAIDPVILEFENRLVEHLAAERLYYSSTLWWRVKPILS